MPKVVDHGARRAEIAAAAALAIDALGLDQVRLVDVARQAGCTTGAVSHYFPDKDAVLAAALEHVLTSLREHPDDPWPAGGGDDPVETALDRLAEFLPLDGTRQRDWRVWLAFCGRAAHAPALAAMHRDAYAALQRQLAGSLPSSLAPDVPTADALAVAIVAGLDGLGTRIVLEPNDWPPDRQRQMLRFQLEPLLRATAAGQAPLPETPAKETSA